MSVNDTYTSLPALSHFLFVCRLTKIRRYHLVAYRDRTGFAYMGYRVENSR